MSETGRTEVNESERNGNDVLRWVIALIAALAIVALLAYARGKPGIDGRAPDPEDATAGLVQSFELA